MPILMTLEYKTNNKPWLPIFLQPRLEAEHCAMLFGCMQAMFIVNDFKKMLFLLGRRAK
jgi:hypothetical protein